MPWSQWWFCYSLLVKQCPGYLLRTKYNAIESSASGYFGCNLKRMVLFSLFALWILRTSEFHVKFSSGVGYEVIDKDWFGWWHGVDRQLTSTTFHDASEGANDSNKYIIDYYTSTAFTLTFSCSEMGENEFCLSISHYFSMACYWYITRTHKCQSFFVNN